MEVSRVTLQSVAHLRDERKPVLTICYLMRLRTLNGLNTTEARDPLMQTESIFIRLLKVDTVAVEGSIDGGYQLG